MKCLKSQTWFSCQSGNGNWPSHGKIRLVGVTKQAEANKDGCVGLSSFSIVLYDCVFELEWQVGESRKPAPITIMGWGIAIAIRSETWMILH